MSIADDGVLLKGGTRMLIDFWIRLIICYVVHGIIALIFTLSTDDATIWGSILKLLVSFWCFAGSIISAYLLDSISGHVVLCLMFLVIPVCYGITNLTSGPISTIFYVAFLIIICIVGAIPTILPVIGSLINAAYVMLGGSYNDNILTVCTVLGIIIAIAEGVLVGRRIYFNKL